MTVGRSYFFGLGLVLISIVLAAVASGQQGWSRVQTIKFGNAGAALNSVYFDGDDIWVVGADGYAARSFDDGRTFQQVSVGVDNGLNDVFARKDKIWMVGDGGVILRSTDEGRSFIKSYYSSHSTPASDPQNPSGGVDLYSVQFVDGETGYIVGDHGLILKTSNGGLSWREQRSGTDAQLFHLSFQDERGWVVGTGGIILHTDNGGQNWYPQRSGVKDDLNRVYFVSDNVGL
ncbi:MAG TPA: YCF48-related protein, partial [Blastocatellia bacterium]|nr:YCF48-related protein [Blastocatellia bacterium]